MNSNDIIESSMNYLRQLDGMKYTLVTPETDVLITNGPPFWNDISKPLPPIDVIRKKGSCCTALANLVRRLNDLPIPGNIPGMIRESCVGGTDSWFKYLKDFDRLVEIDYYKRYSIGTLLIQDYNPVDQGHIALIYQANNNLLDSTIIHNIGSCSEKYNKLVIEKFNDYDDYNRFTHICHPENWIMKV